LSDNGKVRKTVERYTYDRRGRVDTLYVKNGSAAETVLATYEYYPTGSVKQIALGGGALTLGYTYHISGAVKTATAKNVSGGTTLYSETLDYEDCGKEGCTPQYAGNISRMAHSLAHGNTNYSENRDVTYAYDLMNRLVNVDDSEIDLFDEAFAYDAQGRILSQRRGTNVTATSGGEYAYYTQSNKLEKVSVGMSDSVDAKRLMNADSNFVYDADGNMIYDASKKMTVSYDWRGLPTEFAKQELSGDSVRLLMTYDASGNRITKRYERKAAAETAWTLQLATHYTGLGSEIRENGLDNTAKVVVNLPQGLGRYGVENANSSSTNTTPSFEWYLKNHLGSTMLVYGTGSGSASVKATYDYRAFGEQLDITMPLDKVTETFTGKERDDETDLGYFGARYLDQMLGMWVSVDTKRQFASPFLYAGNGVNPINVVDKDGNKIWAVTPEDQQTYALFTSKLNSVQAARVSAIEKDNNVTMYFHTVDYPMKDEKGNLATGFVVANEENGFLGVFCATCDNAQDAFNHEFAGHGSQILNFLNDGHSLSEVPDWIDKNQFDLEKDAFEVQGAPKTDQQLEDLGYQNE